MMQRLFSGLWYVFLALLFAGGVGLVFIGLAMPANIGPESGPATAEVLLVLVGGGMIFAAATLSDVF